MCINASWVCDQCVLTLREVCEQCVLTLRAKNCFREERGQSVTQVYLKNLD